MALMTAAQAVLCLQWRFVCVSIHSQKLQLSSLMAHPLLKLTLLPMQSTATHLH